MFPSVLAGANVGWVAPGLERAAAQMRRIVDLEDQMWLGEDASSSGQVRSRSTLSAMKHDGVFALTADFARAHGEIALELKPIASARADYLDIGSQAAKRAVPARIDVHVTTLFAWWAAYFRGRSVLFSTQGDLASAIGAVIREMELVMQGRLLETGLAELTPTGDVLVNGRSVFGVTELLQALETEISGHAGADVYRALSEAVGCRNKSRVGHGVSGLNEAIVSSSLSAANNAWRGMERAGGECPRILRQMLGQLKARAIQKPSAMLARQALSWAQASNGGI